jgi:NADH-quinone oxidoreductase subunit A
MATLYVPILVMLILTGGFAVVALVLAWILGPSKPDASKNSSYECGMPPVGNARERYSVRFYVVAMLFIVFDLETVFLYLEMLVFLGILLVGYVYVWRMGALEWSPLRGRLPQETKHEA